MQTNAMSTTEMEVADVNEGAAVCCGGPAPKEAGDACCVNDADAKAAGESGCGCGGASCCG